MNNYEADARLKAVLEEIDLPERAYELAERRYTDIGSWIARPESELARYDAHIFVQGSFALGTPIRPINEGEEYDLDFTCKLRDGISRDSHSQKDLKDLIGRELALYREARQIHKPLEEKNRCWRLGYKDELPFHMDVVPGIRANEAKRIELRSLMESRGVDESLAREVARRSLWITDLQDPKYSSVSFSWPSSNPGGYQLWFRSRMQSHDARMLAEAQVDPLPVYRSKEPLQQVVQLLKRHRDVMFKDDPDAKPASIILTTVAGNAYVDGEGLSQSMERVLLALEKIRISNTDEILNPVNPLENFADRWARPDCQKLHLKQNFHRWIQEANRTSRWIMEGADVRMMLEVVERHLDVKVPEHVRRGLGAAAATTTPAIARVVRAEQEPPRPWRAY